LSVCVFDAKNIALANNVCVFVFVWVWHLAVMFFYFEKIWTTVLFLFLLKNEWNRVFANHLPFERAFVLFLIVWCLCVLSCAAAANCFLLFVCLFQWMK
jgi:hypothetical protein